MDLFHLLKDLGAENNSYGMGFHGPQQFPAFDEKHPWDSALFIRTNFETTAWIIAVEISFQHLPLLKQSDSCT